MSFYTIQKHVWVCVFPPENVFLHFFSLLTVMWGRLWSLPSFLFLSHSANVYYFFSFSFHKYLLLRSKRYTFQFINNLQNPKDERAGGKANLHKLLPFLKANKASGQCKWACLTSTARREVNTLSVLLLKSTCMQLLFIAHLPPGGNIWYGKMEGKTLPQEAYTPGKKITTRTWISKISDRETQGPKLAPK